MRKGEKESKFLLFLFKVVRRAHKALSCTLCHQKYTKAGRRRPVAENISELIEPTLNFLIQNFLEISVLKKRRQKNVVLSADFSELL